MKPNFAQRSPEPELMDDLLCQGEVVHQTLRELEFINLWLGGNAVTLNALAQVCRQHPGRPLHIADLGCGSGDMLRLIDRWAKRRGITVHLTGIDANPHIIEHARKNLHDFPDIKLEALDIFSAKFQQRRFDIVIGTLFYHHFSNEDLVAFFRQLRKQVSVALIINDIHRHPLAYFSIRWLTALFSKSAMVQYDAPLSVLRAFHRHELEDILHQANWPEVTIRWKWAFRWQVIATQQT